LKTAAFGNATWPLGCVMPVGNSGILSCQLATMGDIFIETFFQAEANSPRHSSVGHRDRLVRRHASISMAPTSSVDKNDYKSTFDSITTYFSYHLRL